jgi:hypothetical protein
MSTETLYSELALKRLKRYPVYSVLSFKQQ